MPPWPRSPSRRSIPRSLPGRRRSASVYSCRHLLLAGPASEHHGERDQDEDATHVDEHLDGGEELRRECHVQRCHGHERHAEQQGRVPDVAHRDGAEAAPHQDGGEQRERDRIEYHWCNLVLAPLSRFRDGPANPAEPVRDGRFGERGTRPWYQRITTTRETASNATARRFART